MRNDYIPSRLLKERQVTTCGLCEVLTVSMKL